MVVAHAQVASITRLLVLLVAAEVHFTRRGMVVVLARRDHGLGMGKLMLVRRSRGHAQYERAEH